MLPLLFTLPLLPACAEEAPPANNEANVELPQPSGPPVVQQAEPELNKPQAQAASGWSAEGGALRFGEGEAASLILRCRKGKLIVTAPAFKPIGSEDRFSLGLGNEPVTLVADPTRQSGSGVTAEAPAPDDLQALLGNSGQVSALYGTQQAGPYPAPSPQAAGALAAGCK